MARRRPERDIAALQERASASSSMRVTSLPADGSYGEVVVSGGGLRWSIGLHFASRSAAVSWVAGAGVSSSDGTVIWADGVGYVKEAGASAISDMVNWVPFGAVSPRHFGCVGAVMTNLATGSPPPTGATVDESALLQAAMDYALSQGRDLVADESTVYGISSPVVWGLRNNTLTIPGRPVLRGLRLQVVGGTWAAGNLSSSDPAAWTFGPAALIVGKASGYTGGGKPFVGTDDVLVNANRLAPVGIWYAGASQQRHVAAAYNAKEAQVLIGGYPGEVTSLNPTDSEFRLKGAEYSFSTNPADGFNDLSLRTAVGLMVQSSDVSILESTFSGSLYNVVVGDCFNARFTTGKFWSGPTRTEPTSRTAWISSSAHNYTFTATRFDDGQIFVQGFDGKFFGCLSIQYNNTWALTLDATVSGETATDLVLMGNQFQGGSANLTASGAGSWGTFAGLAQGNVDTNTGNAFTVQGYDATFGAVRLTSTVQIEDVLTLKEASLDYATLQSNRGLRIMSDWDANSADAQSFIDIGNDGTVYHRVQAGGTWLFGYGQATSGGAVASLTWSGNKFRITPSDGAGGVSFANRLEYDPAASTWGFYGDIAQYGSDHGFVGAGFSSRAAFVTWASGKTFTDGTIVTAARRQYRYSSGATGISDLPNWLPFGPVYPDHFGYNATAGTTDMTAAILAAATYVKNTFTSGGTVWGSDSVYAVSAPIDVSGFFGVRFEGLNLTAIGTWTAGDPMFLISTSGTASRIDMSFVKCTFEGAQKANGIKIKNYSRVLVQNCKMHGVPLYAVKTDTSAGELMIDGCQFRQYYSGESGWSTAANRTAKLIDISTPDSIVIATVAAYGQYPIYVSGGFNHIQLIGCHFYDGGYTPGSGQPYSGYFDAKDMQIVGNYFDSGIVRVTAGSTGVFSANHLYKSGGAVNTNGIEFYNTGASANLAGLTISNNTADGFPDYTYPVLFTGTWDTNLQMIGGSNATASGRPWAGLPLLGTGNAGVVEVKDDAFVWFSNADATAKARLGLGSVPTGTTTTYFLPNVGGNLLVNNGSATISGQWTVVSDFTINDQNFILRDGADNTKKAKVELAGIATGTTRTLTLPDRDGIVAFNPAFGILNADYTLTGTTSPQKLFNWSTNGAVTLAAGTYEFTCVIGLTTMSATAGNGQFDLKGAGTATIGAVSYHVAGNDVANPTTVGALSGAVSITVASAASMVTPGTAAGLGAKIQGMFVVSAAGTIIPSIALVTAAAAVVKAGSFFSVRYVGPSNVTSDWS